jgi:ATP-dependent DNA helicase RecG
VTDPLDEKLSVALGGRTASSLQRGLGLATVGDLLSHYPRRYARRGELTALSDLRIDETVTIVAEVLEVRSRSMQARRGSILEVLIGDGRGTLTLTFFNQKWRENELRPRRSGHLCGQGRRLPQFTAARASRLRALRPGRGPVGGQGVGRDADSDLPGDLHGGELADPEGDGRRARHSSRSRGPGAGCRALRPRPDPVPSRARAHPPARRRRRVGLSPGRALTFQEAFVLQAGILLQRERLRATAATPRSPGALLEDFDSGLPFTLTGDQRAVGAEIAADLAADVPMNRLVQGEVGSGKTLVALRAMLAVAESGGQSALLAPTEVLAHQHLRSIVRTLGPELSARLRPTILTGQLSTAERRKALLAIVSGSARIVVGTHALLGDSVTFFDLGLVVVDEQHRFGVEQREALRVKGAGAPHVLVLTATPIPRTVAMTVFGDLDISSIAELPAGRGAISSHVVPLAEKPTWMSRVWERVAEELEQGRQAFVVCPAIDESIVEDVPLEAADDAQQDQETGGAAPRTTSTVTETLAHLRENPLLAGRRIEALHGRLSSDAKDALMRAFAEGSIDVLVATTVIEVGVDVANASTMVVLDADRFGVSQLHQLRGRVGRGSVPGLCLLVTAAVEGTLARERVEAVAATIDGFELAQRDLELRQEGDVLGSIQSGRRSSLRLVRVTRDGELIGDARALAAQLLAEDTALESHPALRAALDRRLDEESQAFLSKN